MGLGLEREASGRTAAFVLRIVDIESSDARIVGNCGVNGCSENGRGNDEPEVDIDAEVDVEVDAEVEDGVEDGVGS